MPAEHRRALQAHTVSKSWRRRHLIHDLRDEWETAGEENPRKQTAGAKGLGYKAV